MKKKPTILLSYQSIVGLQQNSYNNTANSKTPPNTHCKTNPNTHPKAEPTHIYKIFSKISYKPIDIVGIRVYIIINIKKAIHF